MSGLWAAPLWLACLWLVRSPAALALLALLFLLLAPLPSLFMARRREARLNAALDGAREEAERARHLCDTMRYRVQRLTEELSDADRQARLAHQMSLLGQFVAGFMHEVNNPLGILTGRVEVLLAERGEDAQLCRDLEEILAEARYIDKIAGTLLPALRQSQGGGTFEPAMPGEVAARVLASLEPAARAQGAVLHLEASEAPRANMPAHVLEQVLRALVANALQALEGREGGHVTVRLLEGRPGRPSVAFEVEDDGPGIPPDLRDHLFEPFVSRAAQQRRSGLGLFIVASLLKMYDGSVRLEASRDRGALFVVEVPRARFTREQPYHWFVSPLEAVAEREP